MDALYPSLGEVLAFLQDGVTGLKAATLKRPIASLFSVLPQYDGLSISTHPITKHFLRGVSLKCPPTIHRFPSWNLHSVLLALTGPPLEPLKEVALKWLRMKVIFLVTVTSARRVSEIGALSIKNYLCVFRKETVVLTTDPILLPKVSSEFHRSQEISLPSFCTKPKHTKEKLWHTLDVRRALKTFIIRTESIRNTDCLFINISPNLGKRMSKATLSRTLKLCIIEAYRALKKDIPSGITVYSIRSTSTNAVLINRASVEEICRAATWYPVSTFVRH